MFRHTRELYRQTLGEYASAVRQDIDAIIEAVNQGAEISDEKVTEYRNAIAVLDDALNTYVHTRPERLPKPVEGV
jgi:hypothetical protein